MTAALDHLVVLAASLDEGAAWCEATLGVTPGPGGEHPLMGTHNRLLRTSSPAFPQSFLEIIAINNIAQNGHPTRTWRWFDMDNPVLKARVVGHGPQLIHWVARVPDVQAAVARLAAQGIDRGPAIAATRQTPRGLLQWQITVRDDGQRLFAGCLPTLIQWGAAQDTPMTVPHPADALPHSAVTLQSLELASPDAAALNAAFPAIGLHDWRATAGPARLLATLATPKGLITLDSGGH